MVLMLHPYLGLPAEVGFVLSPMPVSSAARLMQLFASALCHSPGANVLYGIFMTALG